MVVPVNIGVGSNAIDQQQSMILPMQPAHNHLTARSISQESEQRQQH